MEVGKLTAQYRDTTGKGISRRLRMEGLVPATCYGAGMETPVSISLSPKSLKASLDPAKKRNTVIELSIEKDGKVDQTFKAMVWDFQVDPIKQVITHVDLKAIDTEKPVEATIPVKPQGKHAGAIDGGLLSWDRHDVTVLCKPELIPTELLLDITSLNLGMALHISDLPLPEGVSFVDSPKLTLVSCVAPKGADKKAVTEQAEEAPAAEEKK
jgi:large subunit ribosomal protein L25